MKGPVLASKNEKLRYLLEFVAFLSKSEIHECISCYSIKVHKYSRVFGEQRVSVKGRAAHGVIGRGFFQHTRQSQHF